MSSIGSFASMTQARLGIYAAQNGLSVTGNNIANINTEGYTRQRLEQSSFAATGSDRYYSATDVKTGNGVLCTGISQIRDGYMDVRYRSQASNAGAMNARYTGLDGLSAILDEVGDGEDGFGILGSQFQELYEAFQTLTDQTGHNIYDTQVRATAQTLTDTMRSYANRLSELYNNSLTSFKEDIVQVNQMLKSISNLSYEIRKSEIRGDKALELRDQRNTLIDSLSEYIKIDVIYEMEDIGGGAQVEKLILKLAGANPDPSVPTDYSTILESSYCPQFSILSEDNMMLGISALKDSKDRVLYSLTKAEPELTDAADYGDGLTRSVYDETTDTTTITTFEKKGDLYYKQVYTRAPSQDIALDDNDLYGAFQSASEMLTEQGEFSTQDTILNIDEYADEKRGIPYYQKALDLLAKQFADALNAANTGYLRNEKGQYIDADGNALIFNSAFLSDGDALDEDQLAYLKENGVRPGFNLFSTGGDTDSDEGLNASNISISYSWGSGKHVITSYVKPTGMEIATTDNSNVLHMISMFTEDMDYIPSKVQEGSTDNAIFTGSFIEMWDNIGFVLGSDMKITSTLYDNYSAAATELDSARISVSSVDLNDEAMNLMQYSKSYSAACRLMTTLDSLLDKLINGTAI